MFPAYLIAGLLGIAALCWILYQANLRHRRVQAELLRLDRLAAEVTLHAEAVLDQVDERIAQLQKLMDAASAQVAAAASAPTPTPAPTSIPAPTPAPAAAPRHTAPPAASPAASPYSAYRPLPEPAPAPAPAAAQPAAAAPQAEADPPRSSELREQVVALAEGGSTVAQIAQALGIPRGEVGLILNLNKKKASA